MRYPKQDDKDKTQATSARHAWYIDTSLEHVRSLNKLQLFMVNCQLMLKHPLKQVKLELSNQDQGKGLIVYCHLLVVGFHVFTVTYA